MKRITKLVAWMLPAVVLLSVWFPAVSKYRVSISVEPGAVERMRTMPSDDRLGELAKIRLSGSSGLFADAPRVADAILAGQPISTERDSFHISAKFSEEEVLAGSPKIALAMSSFAVPEIFIRAYAETGNARYLAVATDYVRDWADYEDSLVVPPPGLFWNDHAIAARGLVLTEFWFHYRRAANRNYDPEFARKLVGLVDRYGQMLSQPALYTYRSNHGTMQNLVLMVLALGFPELERAPAWGDTGYRRFVEHMQYFIGLDGVLSEHSPGYQPFGMALVAASLRCATLLGKSIPPDLAERFEQSKVFYAQLRRPDGTVPTFGDSDRTQPRSLVAPRLPDGGYGPLQPFTPGRPAPVTLHPDGGMLIWWNGLDGWPASPAISQLAVTWSNWPSRVHKHADEPSLVLWSAGRQWIGNSGYFPYYDARGREMSEGWPGANAPHLAGEAWGSERETRPLRHVATSTLSFFEVERKRPDGFAVRRQILQHSPDLWLIIDSTEDPQQREVHTVWTTDPKLSAAPSGAAGVFALRAPGDAAALEIAFAGSSGHDVSLYRGSQSPYLGWASAEGQVVTPTPAFLVRQPSKSGWSVMVAATSRSGHARLAATPRMEAWSGPDHWSVRLETRDGPILARRAGADLELTAAAGTVHAKAETAPPPVHREKMEAAYHEAAASGPGRWYEDFVPYRLRVTYLVLALVAGQLIVFAAAGRLVPRYSASLAALAAVCWIGVGAWLNFVYFA